MLDEICCTDLAASGVGRNFGVDGPMGRCIQHNIGRLLLEATSGYMYTLTFRILSWTLFLGCRQSF